MNKSQTIGLSALARIISILLAVSAFAWTCEPGKDDKNKGGLASARNSIVLRGGAGDAGAGGEGGVMLIESSFYSETRLSTAGGAAISGTPPRLSAPDLGPRPWIVDEDYTVNVYLDQTDANLHAVNGEYLLWLGDDALYQRERMDHYLPITGIKIERDVTLTLGLNLNLGGETGEDAAVVTLPNDLVNPGTLTVKSLDTGTLAGTVELIDGAPATNRDSGALSLVTLNLFSSGQIDAAGENGAAPGERGGYGGMISLVGFLGADLAGAIDASGGDGNGSGNGGEGSWLADSASNVSIISYDALADRALVDVSGGQGGGGGNSGSVTLMGNGRTYIAGGVVADGGAGLNGNGGTGGGLTLMSMGALLSRAELSARGGDAFENGVGGPVLAGVGGQVFLYCNPCESASTIDASGGNAYLDGAGGRGGEVYFFDMVSFGVGTKIAGQVVSLGGFSEGPGNDGGKGGALMVVGFGGGQVSADVDLSGGDGDVGGNGGAYLIEDNIGIDLVGCREIVIEGGAGAVGGAGGGIEVGLGSGVLDFGVPVLGDAGQSLAGAGAPGGRYQVTIASGALFHHADLFLRGSDAADGDGGMGGEVTISSIFASSFRGEVDLSGGDAAGPAANIGGAGGLFNLTCDEDLNVLGAISANGGAGVNVGPGGIGGLIALTSGQTLQSRATYETIGGDADLTAGTGGPGGLIFLQSDLGPTVHHGPFDATGGAGLVLGANGAVLIDGAPVWP